MNNLDDITYIERIRQGDAQAFVYLLRRYRQVVFSLVLRIVENQADAEDVTQDIFIKVYQSLDKFRGDAKFSTWLYRVAYNQSVTHIRHKRENSLPLCDESLSDGEPTDFEENIFRQSREEQLRCLDQALNLLSAEDLWIVTLYYKAEASVREIANITGLSESNVKVKLHRIRLWLKTEIEKNLKL